MFSQQVSLSVRCVKCRAKRELPEADRKRWPAAERSGAVTLETDAACGCGSKRVRVTINLR